MLKRLALATSLLLAASVPARAAFDAGDIICETSTTTGTGTLSLAGAVTNYVTFLSQITSGSSVNYHITASDGKLETGIGVFTDATPDTLTRVAHWSTDGSGSELNLAAGTHTVCLGPTISMFAGMKGFQLYSEEDAVTGALLPFWHNDPSADANDIPATIEVYGGADDEEVGSIDMLMTDPATTTEDTQWRFVLRRAGSDMQALTLGTTGAGNFAHTFQMGANDFANVVIESTADTNAGPGLVIYGNSATPAGSDDPGYITFHGEDSAGNEQEYGLITQNISSPTSTSEASEMLFAVQVSGARDTLFSVGDTDGVDLQVSPSVVAVDANSALRIYEAEANGDNYKGFISAAANTADTTCTFENDANFIPDSCVGDGVDGSDARLKDIKGPLENPGAVLDQIKIYDYTWNTDSEKSEGIRRGKRGVGPSAQELFNVNPDFVDVGGENPIDDPWTWKPEKIVPYLIAEVQNLRKNLKTCYGLKLGGACIGVSM